VCRVADSAEFLDTLSFMSPPAAGLSLAGAVARAALAAIGLALVFAVAAEFRSLKAARQEAFAWLVRAGVTLDAAAIGREPDAERVRLRAARAVLAAELYPSRHQGIPPQQAARESAERLAEAAAAGREIFARRPASWEAALVQGAATYLSWAQARDPRLFTAYREWEAPLEAALRLAPGKREPARFLAAAYLEIWPALSPRKREMARGLLAEVFREPQDLARLLGPWLETAADRREVFSVLPDNPLAWKQVADAYAQRGDLSGFAAARSRGEEALLAALRRDLLEADRLRGDGRLGEARGLYLSVAERARPEARYLGLVERAIERCPPGPVDRETAERLAPHFVRALDRCLFAGCEMSPASMKRLSRFMRDPPPPQAALAAVFANDLSRAALYERRTPGLDDEPWAPYLIARARLLAARGRVDEARDAVSQVHSSWHQGPLYWQARADVARAAGDAGGLTEALARLAERARSAWLAPDWTWHRNVARLEMFTGRPANGLAVVLDSVPEGGALVELRLDGAAVGVFPVRRVVGTAASLRIVAPFRGGLHVLELESLGGGQVLPGRVELR
jgi:hypothetical protein